MKNASVIEAFKFGIYCLIKKPLFFLGALLTTTVIMIVGLILKAIAMIPLVYPLMGMLAKLRMGFEALLGKYLLMFAGGGETAALPAGGFEKAKSLFVTFLRDVLGLLWAHPGVLILLGLSIFLFFVLFTAVFYYIYAGWIRISLDFYDKGSSKISALFSRFSVILKFLCAGLIYSIVILLPWKISFLLFFLYPSVLLAVPLIILSIVLSFFFGLKFFYYPYFIVDQNAGIFESLGKAYRLKGAALRIIFSFIIVILVSFVFGWIVSYMGTVGVVLAWLYRISYWIVMYMVFGFLYRRLLAG